MRVHFKVIIEFSWLTYVSVGNNPKMSFYFDGKERENREKEIQVSCLKIHPFNFIPLEMPDLLMEKTKQK
jgi:hypothetical protein